MFNDNEPVGYRRVEPIDKLHKLLLETCDGDLLELAVLAAGFEIFYVGDNLAAIFYRDPDTKSARRYGPFNALESDIDCMTLLANATIKYGVACISVGSDKAMCEFMSANRDIALDDPKTGPLNGKAAIRRVITMGCIKRFLEYNHIRSALSSGDLHRQLRARGLLKTNWDKGLEK